MKYLLLALSFVAIISVSSVYLPIARASFLISAGNMRIMSSTSFSGTAATVASAYTGPGDVATFSSYWSTGPCYSASYANGSNSAFILKRASDSTTQTIACLTTGLPDYATATTFCNATTCTVRSLTDQAGGGRNLDDANGQTLPAYTASALGTCAGMTYNGGATTYLTGSSPTQAQPFFLQTLAKRTTGGSLDPLLDDNSGIYWRFWFTDQRLSVFSGTANALGVDGSPVDNTFNNLSLGLNGASTFTSVNNTDTTVNTNPGATGLSNSNKFLLGSDPGGGELTGVIVEAGYISSIPASGTRGSLNTNLHAQCGSW